MATTTQAMGWTGPVGGRRSALAADWRTPDRRRSLQLVLAAIWLLDAVLQFQPYMFTRAFGNQMIAASAVGNPGTLAHQITWAGRAIGHHAVAADTAFGLVQLVIALGIAWRPTVRIALAGSVVWALAVWWIGEGLGGVLTRAATPLTGTPGAVILYALLALLLWPSDRSPSDRHAPDRHSSERSAVDRSAADRSAADRSDAPFVAARPLGAPVARALWLVLWGSLAYYSLQAAGRSAQGLHDTILSMAAGQPGWLVSVDHAAARLVAGRGLAFSIGLALAFALVAVGPYLPVAPSRATLVLAVVLAVVIWVVGEAFGDIFSGSGTDPNTGPLLLLLAAAFWPRSAGRRDVDPTTGSAAPAPPLAAVVGAERI